MAITKLAAEYFAHTTSKGSLDKMLESKRLYSPKHISEKDPDKELSVEPYPFVPVRKKKPAREALESMKKNKDPDKIFLTKDFYDPMYGDRVITKKLKEPKEQSRSKTIPNEHYTRRPLSLKNNSKIYVPDKEVSKYQKNYKEFDFAPISQIPLKRVGKKDRLNKLVSGFKKESSINDNFIRKNISTKGMLVGSEALGTAVPESSDVDVFVPYKNKGHFERSIGRLREKYPDLKIAPSSENKEDKRVLTGTVRDRPIDITVAYGDNAENFQQQFSKAKQQLTPEEQRKIQAKKKKLKDAKLFPEKRYKKYKDRVSKDLGLKKAYF